MTASIEVVDAGFSYGAQQIFGEVSLRVQSGETLCLLGPNGCGKTTLLRCLSGSLRLQHGSIRIEGRDITAMRTDEIARTVGIVFQEHSAPFPYSVLEVVRMGRAPHLSFFAMPSKRDTEVAGHMLELVGLAHLRDKAYTRISGGERQLVLIARTLCQEPKVLLMDEPTSHLDFKNQALVLAMAHSLAERGLAVVMSTHLPNQALQYPSKVALMSDGRLLAVGDAGDVITEASLSRTYGIEVRIFSTRDEQTGRTLSFCTPVVGAAMPLQVGESAGYAAEREQEAEL